MLNEAIEVIVQTFLIFFRLVLIDALHAIIVLFIVGAEVGLIIYKLRRSIIFLFLGGKSLLLLKLFKLDLFPTKQRSGAHA